MPSCQDGAVEPFVDDAVQLEHHSGTFKQVAKFDKFRKRQYIAAFASARRNNLNIRRIGRIQRHRFQVDPVDKSLQRNKTGKLEFRDRTRKINEKSAFGVALVDATASCAIDLFQLGYSFHQ